MKGKIIKGIAGFYYVHDGRSKIYECKAKGVFRNRNIKPLVGDDVEFMVLDEKEGTGNIDAILPRKNKLIRPAVSNVDQAVVVFAVTEPLPNLNLLDRFLVMMERQEIPVIICFNKIDLSGGKEIEELRAIYGPAGYTLHFISTYEAAGLEKLHELIAGKPRFWQVLPVSASRQSPTFCSRRPGWKPVLSVKRLKEESILRDIRSFSLWRTEPI